MGERLAEIGDWLQDLIYGKRIHNFNVLCPISLVGILDGSVRSPASLAKMWSKDPIHLSAAGYAKEVDGILDEITDPEDRQRSNSAQKAAHRTWAGERMGWVQESDSFANRTKPSSWRPGWTPWKPRWKMER